MKKAILIAGALSLAAAGAGLADVTYEQEAKMGGFMKVLTLGRGQKTVTRISGDKMRTETGRDVRIIDISAEKIYQLDTKKKTYTVMTFEQMRQQIQAAMATAKAAGQERPEGEEGSQQSMSAEVQVTDTGHKQTIKGYDCRQVLMQLDMTIKDEESGEESTLSSVTELWLTEEAPGVDEINAFHRRMAEKLGTTELGKRMTSGQNPLTGQFSAGMRRTATEMKKMKGFAMRSVFYFGSAEAAREEARANATGEKKKKGGGFGGFLKKAIPKRGEGDEEGGEDAKSQETVLMKMTLETKKIETKPIKPALFSVPDNYKQVELEQN
ncbi:MAG: hypothetical protein ACE5JI_20845 [Acidobacteriota bacterium]